MKKILLLVFVASLGIECSALAAQETNSLSATAKSVDLMLLLQRARTFVVAGTHAGERNSNLSNCINYLKARDLYYCAYTNVLALQTQGITNVPLDAKVLAEYGWFLYKTSETDSSHGALGTNLVITALGLCPTNANINAKAAMLYITQDMVARTYGDKQGDKAALTSARKLYKRALELDPNYGYACWGLGQIAETPNERMDYLKRFVALSNRLDMELWLYDEQEHKQRLAVARRLISDFSEKK